MGKKVLVIGSPGFRGNTRGLVGAFIDSLSVYRKEGISISLFDTNYYIKPNASDFNVDGYYYLRLNEIDTFIKKIPLIRSLRRDGLIVSTFKKIMSQSVFDLVIIYQVIPLSDKIIEIAHKYGSKVLLYPFGSDILRTNSRERKRIGKAFTLTDFVGGAEDSNTMTAALNIYNVDRKKLRYKMNYLKSVELINSIRGKYSRKEMSEIIGIPLSEYNIVCSYKAAEDQLIEKKIEEIAKVREFLPQGYQLVFLMSYGSVPNISTYIEEVKIKCKDNRLNATIIEDYVTPEQMAMIHLVTDLFITIQPTDCGNAFLIEAIVARNTIITGEWLHYKHFEKYGIPYYLIPTPDALADKVKEVVLGNTKEIQIPEELIQSFIAPVGYDKLSYWRNIINEA